MNVIGMNVCMYEKYDWNGCGVYVFYIVKYDIYSGI